MYKKTVKIRNTYNKTHNNSSEQMRFNTREMFDAEEDELGRDTAVLNDYIQVTSRNNTRSNNNGSSSSSSTSVRTERIQSLLKPVLKDDSADIEQCQKDRQKFINAINGHTKSGKKKSSTTINGGDKDNHRHSSSTEQMSIAGVMETLLDLPVTRTSASNATALATNSSSVQDVTNTLAPLQEGLLEDLPNYDVDNCDPDAGEEMEMDENNETEPAKGKEKHRGLSKREGRKKRKEILLAIATAKAAKQESTAENAVSVPVPVPVPVAATTAITSPVPHSSIPADNNSALQTPLVNNYVITTPHTNNPSPAYFVDISEDSQLSAPPIDPEQSSELRDMAVAMAESVNDAYPTSTRKSYFATGRSNSRDAYDVIDLVSSDDEADVTPRKIPNTTSRSNTSTTKPLILSSTPLEHASISSTTTKSFAAKQSTNPTSSHTTKPAPSFTTAGTYTTTSGTSSAVADFFKPKPSSAIKKRPFHTLDSDIDTDDSGTEDENNTGIKRQRLSSNKTAKSGTSSGKGKNKGAKDNMVWEKETLQVEEAEKKRLRALASYKHFKDDGKCVWSRVYFICKLNAIAGFEGLC